MIKTCMTWLSSIPVNLSLTRFTMATAFLFSASGLGPLSSSAEKEQYLVILAWFWEASKHNWLLGKHRTNSNYNTDNDIFKTVGIHVKTGLHTLLTHLEKKTQSVIVNTQFTSFKQQNRRNVFSFRTAQSNKFLLFAVIILHAGTKHDVLRLPNQDINFWRAGCHWMQHNKNGCGIKAQNRDIRLGWDVLSSVYSYHKMACVPSTVSLLVFRDSHLHLPKDLVTINN